MKPALLVIAGPNGAGKTTVTTRLRDERWSDGVEYLNADDVARDRFGDWNSPEAVLNAAQLFRPGFLHRHVRCRSARTPS